MSGSGTGDGGGPARSNDTLDCAKLFEHTIINSPDPKVLKKLKAGDQLAVSVTAKRVVIVVTTDGDTAGSITSSRMLQFIDCIERGFEYIAIVKSVAGGRCESSRRLAGGI